MLRIAEPCTLPLRFSSIIHWNAGIRHLMQPPAAGFLDFPRGAGRGSLSGGRGGGSLFIGYRGIAPKCHGSVFVAEGAMVIGDVEIGEDSSVWFHTVIRGDIHRIRIGKRTTLQGQSKPHMTYADARTISS